MKKLKTFEEFQSLNEAEVISNPTFDGKNREFITNGENKGLIYRDKDFKLFQKIKNKINKKYFVKVREEIHIFNGDRLPKAISFSVYLNKKDVTYRGSALVHLQIENGKMWFESAFSDFSNKGVNDIAKTLKTNKLNWSSTNIAGQSSLTTNGNYPEIKNEKDLMDILDFTFDDQKASDKRMGDYYRDKGPSSGIGSPD